jgi:hypothetical protein
VLFGRARKATQLRLMYAHDVRAEEEAIMFGNVVIYAKTRQAPAWDARGLEVRNATAARNLLSLPSTTLTPVRSPTYMVV